MTLFADQTETVRLSRLVAGVSGVELRLAGTSGDPDVIDVVQHSRRVDPGALFCCVRGSRSDGHDLAGSVAEAGAVALLVDHELDVDLPQVVTPDVRAALGPVASHLWGDPSSVLTVVGVTGTNGKTTVTHLLAAILAAAGRPTRIIGTLSPSRASGVPTTPEATELQAELAAAVEAGQTAVAVEVSSHALDAGRVDATRFAAGIFTNLSPEHLDHHGTLERYFAAKARLFEPGRCEHAVINADDEHGRRLLADLASRPDQSVHPFSLADATQLRHHAGGADFRWRDTEVHLRLPGDFNVSNAIAAATAAAALGVDPEEIAAGLGAATPVRGRFEVVDRGQDYAVVVDYAHTPDSLRAALLACRSLAGGAVHVVFGCGGDRDPSKRPLMGSTADRFADRVTVTSDNPRSEDPETIIAAITAPMAERSGVDAEPDRGRAIHRAVAQAEAGDVVLIAGKGHETEQILGDRRIAFDDREVAARAIEAVRGGVR
jgi:UDP-N-acetylmuramoyl-L-alanyl-D-glutamate--2,6-diaminopimelate ligase